MDKDNIWNFIRCNKGKTIGVLIGIIFGILVLTIGFWHSVFLGLCIFIGYWLGGSHDKKDGFPFF